MAETKRVLIPDIGDFKDVPVIEVLVKAGDKVKAEDSLIVLESDKATIEVPSPFSGVVKDVSVKVDDKVSEGTPVLEMEVSAKRAPHRPNLRLQAKFHRRPKPSPKPNTAPANHGRGREPPPRSRSDRRGF